VLTLAATLWAPVPGATAATSRSTGLSGRTAPANRAQTDDEVPRLAGGPMPVQPAIVRVERITTFVAPTDTLELDLDLSAAPPGSTLELRLRTRVTSGRQRFFETMAGQNLGSTVRTYRDLPVNELPRQGRLTQLSLAVVDTGAAPMAGFRIDQAGVYPLEVTVFDADGGQLDRVVTHVVRLPTSGDETVGAPLAVAATVPVDAPLALRPDGVDAFDAAAIAGIDRAVDALADQPDVALTVAPGPETLEALARRDAAQGTDRVRSLANALRGRQVVARPWAPLAAGSWPASGDPDQLVRQLDVGMATVNELLGVTPRRGTWLVDPTIDPPTLALLRRLGVDQVMLAVLQLDALPSSIDRTLTRTFQIRDGDGVAMPAIAADTRLQAELALGDQPALAANRVLADLAVLYFDESTGQRGVVVAASGGAATPAALTPLLAGLRAASQPAAGGQAVLEPVTLDTLFAVTETAATDGSDVLAYDDATPLERRWTWQPPADLGSLPSDIDRSEATVGAYRSTLPSGDDAIARQIDAFLLAAAARDVDPVVRQGLLDAAAALADAQLHSIVAPDQGSVTLTASEGSFPFVLENRAAEPRRVRLTLTAEKLDFPDGDIVDTVLQPGTNRVEIRVRARASGRFPAEVTVTTPDGDVLLVDTTVRVRSTAVSGLGIVLSVAAGLFLALWWVRNLRSTRRQRRLIDSRHPSRQGSSGPRHPALVDLTEDR
jgi:hypothetical protein